MKQNRLVEHLLILLLVGGVFIALYFFARQIQSTAGKTQSEGWMGVVAQSGVVDFNHPFHEALLQDVADVFFPESPGKNQRIVRQYFDSESNRFVSEMQSGHLKERMSAEKLVSLLGMYIKFFIAYLLVMAVTYYGVQTLGTWMFIRRKRESEPKNSRELVQSRRQKSILRHPALFPLFQAARFAGSLILFSPAYVVAYAFRTEFGTDMLLFILLLGVGTNGLLMMYANKFLHFLVTESRKGYVETAKAKNLNDDYRSQDVSIARLFRLNKNFDGHVLGHIFKNAQFQYLSTIKEQAGFVITGLIIIEMALNIHGYLNYEMLRQLLHQNYDIVVVIIGMLFVTVKLTDLATDGLSLWLQRKYANRRSKW